MGEQVVGGDQDPPLRVPEDRVGGAVAGAVQRLQGAVAEDDLLAVGQRPGDRTCEPQPRKLRGDALQGHRSTSSGMPLRSIRSTAKRSSASASSLEVGEALGGGADRRDLGAGVLGDDLDQAEVVDVLVGDDDQLEVVDRVAALTQLALQLVERLARVGAGVDQGQRLVLEQVAVDPADRERGRDAEAVDAGQRRLLERLLRGQGHARISAQDLVAAALHVLAGDERLEVEPQQRLGVGGPHVEVPLGVVDRDPVEVGDLAVGAVALDDLLHLRRRVVDLGVDLAGDEVASSGTRPSARRGVRPSLESSSSISSAGIVPESAFQKSRK